MKRILAILGGGALGVAIMLGILQPWRKAAPPARPSPHRPDLSERVTRARSELQAGRLNEARMLLNAELEAHPLSAVAYLLLAEADLQTGDLIGGQRRLANAASIDPDLLGIPLLQGHFDMLRKDYRSAVRSYGDTLKQEPKNAEALTGRATARFELGEAAGAVEDATAALALDGSRPQALFTRAAAYGRLGRWPEAVRDWTAYLSSQPKDSQGWHNRGIAQKQMGNDAAAEADWEQARKLEAESKVELKPVDADQ